MNKGQNLILASSIALACLPALANGYGQVQLPDLPDYYASAPPAPTAGERASDKLSWLKNFYISGRFGYSSTYINDIDNESATPGEGFILPPVANTDSQERVMNGGVAIGYQLRSDGGIFSRIEIEYMHRGKVNYNADPVLVFNMPDEVTNSLTSKVQNQTLLAKVYYDMNFGLPVIPFIQLGAGVSRNVVDTNGTFQELGEPLIESNSSNTTTNLAFDAGAGVRLKLTKHLSFGVAYEFDWLGKLKWQMSTGENTDPIMLETNNFYAHNFIANVTLTA